MLELTFIDLCTDVNAGTYVKDEVVHVVFAEKAGEVQSREGPNHYRCNDALITGSTGDRWSVSRNRFDEKYAAIPPLVHGESGSYRAKPIPVRAMQMREPFTVARCAGGDVLHGLALDWVLQYAPGDYGVIENTRFQRVYKPA